MSEQPLDFPAIDLKPIISYPREAQAGETYLMTIDVQLASPSTPWPYPEEEYPISFVLDTRPYFSYEPLGGRERSVILHCFGGTYGPVQYVLTATSEAVKPGHIYVTLINGGGLPIGHLELPCEIKQESQSGQVRKTRLPGRRRPMPAPAKFEPPQPVTLSGHRNIVWSCTVSPDGRFIVSASVDHTLKAWNFANGKELLTLVGHTDAVEGCTISSDGRFIVSASHDHTLKIWDASTGAELSTLIGHTDKVWSCAMSPDSRFIVSASADRTLKVWDFVSRRELFTLSGHTSSVYSCAVSPDSRYIVSASYDDTLKIWDASTGAEVATLSGHGGAVWRCVVSNDGRFIVSASADCTLKIWDFANRRELFTLSGHTDKVHGCAISPDNRYIVSASADGTLKVWETASGVERFTLTGHLEDVYGCAVSPNGRFIISASWDSTLKIWDVAERVRNFVPVQPAVLSSIESQLIQAGWVVQDTSAISIDAAQGIVIREFPFLQGQADYLLVISGEAIGVIEDKKGKVFPRSAQSIQDQLWQYQNAQPKTPSSIRFQRRPLPFIYGVVGDEIQFTNELEPDARTRSVFYFHRPETLARWLSQAPVGTPNELNDLLRSRLRRMPLLERRDLRNYQFEAIQCLEQSLATNRPRSLIQMATGSGKTHIMVHSAYRLLKYGGAKRILFLTDRNVLATQIFTRLQQYTDTDTNQHFSDEYRLQLLEKGYFDLSANVCVSTIQTLSTFFVDSSQKREQNIGLFPSEDLFPNENLFPGKATESEELPQVNYQPEIPFECFDVIFIDDCHPTIYSLWRPILEYFDAFLIGITSTLDKLVLSFFNDNRVYRHENQRARALILTALAVEYKETRAYLNNLNEEVFKGTIYERGLFNAENQDWEILIVEHGMGNLAAALEAQQAIGYFQPNIVLSIGVAGGLRDVKIGDVVIASKVYAYEHGKASAGFQSRAGVLAPTFALTQRARAIVKNASWLEYLSDPRSTPTPDAYVAPIVSGEKIYTSTGSGIYKSLVSIYSDAHAIDMESAGFLTAVSRDPSLEMLVIRGISDLIDSKLKVDVQESQKIAAQHASAFAFELLSKLQLPQPQKGRRDIIDGDDNEYHGLVALPYDDFERFLREQENEYWLVDKRSIEEFITGHPASVDELMYAIAMNGDSTQRVYLFRSDMPPEEVIEATDLENIPEITRKDINDKYIISSKGNDFLAFDCNTDEASNCEPAILLPYENEEDRDRMIGAVEAIDIVYSRFSAWLANQQQTRPQPFTEEQIRWLERVRDRFSSAGSFTEQDFERSPFTFDGGLMAARHLFGNELSTLLKGLNSVLGQEV